MAYRASPTKWIFELHKFATCHLRGSQRSMLRCCPTFSGLWGLLLWSLTYASDCWYKSVLRCRRKAATAATSRISTACWTDASVAVRYATAMSLPSSAASTAPVGGCYVQSLNLKVKTKRMRAH